MTPKRLEVLLLLLATADAVIATATDAAVKVNLMIVAFMCEVC